MIRVRYPPTHHITHSSSSSIQPPATPLPTTTHTAASLNLSVLRRYLPSLTTIVTTAAYTVIYIFRPALSAWEKSGIEGTLFVVRLDDDDGRNTPQHPHQHQHHGQRYAIIVLNRRGLDNFVLYLKRSEEVEVTDEYVIVTEEVGGEVRIWGLWIFEEEGGSTRGSRERVGGVVLECARMVEGVSAGNGDMDGQMDGGEEYGWGKAEEEQQHVEVENGRGDELMAMLNGSVGQGGSGGPAERHAASDQSQALLDLFRKTG